MKPEIKNTDVLRLFYALWPDDGTRASLADLQFLTPGRKTAYANLHLTLAFLGNQPASLLPTLISILHELPRTPLALTIDRIGYFSRKRIAWAGMHETPAPLAALHARLSDLLERHSIVYDAVPEFRPHITLARDAAQPEDFSVSPIEWRVSSAALVQSIITSAGVEYRVLDSLTFRNNRL